MLPSTTDCSSGPPPCRRCGRCCQAGGPALHLEDLSLISTGLLAWGQLVTLRAGEPARDNVAGGLAGLEREIVKIAWREPPGLKVASAASCARETPHAPSPWQAPHVPASGERAGDRATGKKAEAPASGAFACLFHDPAARACLIHARRPAECRALSCRDTRAITALYARDRITRADILDPAGALAELVRFHDARFPAARAAALARLAAAGDRPARRELDDLATAESVFREHFLARTAASPAEADFLFGRPLARVLAPFGVTTGLMP